MREPLGQSEVVTSGDTVNTGLTGPPSRCATPEPGGGSGLACAGAERQRGTACRGCGRRWNSPTQAHCAACHSHFGSASAFDRHLKVDDDGATICTDPAWARTKKGDPVFKLRDDGCWVGWMSPEAQARLTETWTARCD